MIFYEVLLPKQSICYTGILTWATKNKRLSRVVKPSRACERFTLDNLLFLVEFKTACITGCAIYFFPRIESPLSVMISLLAKSLSNNASATVLSPIYSCQCSTGSCVVRIVGCNKYLSSIRSSK